MTSTYRVTPIDAFVQDVRFDARDSKGRQIGCLVSAWAIKIIEDFTWGPNEYKAGETLIAPRVHASRNGSWYGASHKRPWFRTEEEARAYIAKRIADSRKAAAKLAR